MTFSTTPTLFDLTSRPLVQPRARLSQPDTDTPGPTGLAHLTEEAP